MLGVIEWDRDEGQVAGVRVARGERRNARPARGDKFNVGKTVRERRVEGVVSREWFAPDAISE